MSDTATTTAAPGSNVSVDRRRLLSAIAGGALLAGLHPPASLAQQSTPTTENVAQLQALSQTLCGGGVFDDGRTTQLASLIAGDPSLSAGLLELLRGGSATPSPTARSDAANAAAQAILLYWYVGEFKGAPIANHAEVYPQLQAWQAMYTPAWTTCKLYGGWAEPPTMTPQEPENA